MTQLKKKLQFQTENFQNETHVAEKYVKKCPAYLVLREMQTKSLVGRSANVQSL